jgi:hypothetical protein
MASRAVGEDKMNAIIRCTIYINDMGRTRGEIFFIFPNTRSSGLSAEFSLSFLTCSSCFTKLLLF